VKQVLQDRSGLTVVRDVPPPPCPPGSVLVRNLFSAISSGTERARVELSKKSLLAKARERPDLVREVVDRARREGVRSTREVVQRKLAEETPVGYSSAGRVIEVGAAVRGIDVGDLVACAGASASHAEIVSVPRNLCANVPAGVPPEAAALTTIASIALHGMRLADVRVGDRVAVIGCGLVGQITCRLLRAAGAEVFALDLEAARAEAAVRAGADHGLAVAPATSERVLAETAGIGVDQAIITAATSSNDPLLLAAEIARDRGAIVVVGDVRIEAPRAPLYQKELSLRVSRSYGPGRYDTEYEERGLDYPIGYVRWTEKRNMEAILDLAARGRIELGDLIDEVVPVDEAARAYDRLGGPASERPYGALLLSYDGEEGLSRDALTVVRPHRRDRSLAPSTRTAPIRIGLIGPGAFASKILIPAFASAGARLELVGGGSGPSAESTKRRFGFARIAESAEAVIADEDVDAVIVATRHGTHADLSIRALQAGKHVFSEKPLVLSAEELESVLAAAADARGILAVGFNRRFSPPLRELRDFLTAPASRIAASYRVSAGRLETDHWTHDLDEGGGRILGEVCHFVDSLRFLTGADVEDVHATAYGAPDLPVQARDRVAVILTFSDGSIGTILYVADGSPAVPKERIEAYTVDRTGILDDYRSLDLFGPTGKRTSRPRQQDKGHQQEVEAFLRGIEHGVPPVALDEIANVSLATLAVVESLRTSRPVRLVH
jgi:predicted dehydrogenase/threonine dehydrogenase-like Zn-dependent dehydrogenase